MKQVSLVTTIFICMSGVACASTVFSENFDTVNTGLVVTGTIGQFHVTSGNVDIVGTFPTNNFGELCVSPETTNCVDLDGETNASITSTPILLMPGFYTFSFALNGSQRGAATSTTVNFAGFSNTYNLTSSSTNTFTVPITVSTAGSSNVVFTSNTPGPYGALLDNVLVTFDSPLGGVPEPASYGLVVGALAVIFLVRTKVNTSRIG